MEQMRIEERVTEIKCRCKEKINYCSRMFRFHSNYLIMQGATDLKLYYG